MDISPCSSIPDNRLVNSQTEYDRAYNSELIKPLPAASAKKSFSPTSPRSQKKRATIILDGKPSSHPNLEATMESAVENEEIV